METVAEELEPGDCWSLLRSGTLGRLAVSTEAGPEIFPVNYVVNHGAVVFRTGEGTKLSAMLASPSVAFEIDGQEGARSWSVVVKGQARRLTGLHESIDAARLPLNPDHAGPKANVVELLAAQVSGRRFVTADPAVWATALTGSRHAASE